MRKEKVRWQRDDDMRTADTLEPCMCVTRIRMCEMYAQCQCCTTICVQKVSVHVHFSNSFRAWFESGDRILYPNSHINNLIGLLILVNLDVLGAPGWSSLGWWVSFLCAIFLMIRDFSTSTRPPCDRRAASLPCMITNVWLHLLVKTQMTQGLSCRESSRGACCGPPTAFSIGHRCAVGVLAGTHRVPQSPGWLCGKAPTLLVVAVGVVGVVTSCGLCVRVPRSVCNWEYLHPCSTGSAVQALSRHHSQSSQPTFSGLWVFSSMKFFPNKSWLTRSSSRYLLRDLIALFLLAACSVAIHLVHSNANLFLSRKIDQLRSILSVFGSYCNLRDGRHAVLRVNSVASILNCRQSAKLQKELVDPNEGGCVSAWIVGDLLGGTPHHQHCSPNALDFEVSLMMSCHDVCSCSVCRFPSPRMQGSWPSLSQWLKSRAGVCPWPLPA